MSSMMSLSICSSLIEPGFRLAMFSERSPFSISISAFFPCHMRVFCSFFRFCFLLLLVLFSCAVLFSWFVVGLAFWCFSEWYFLLSAAPSLFLQCVGFFSSVFGVFVFCLLGVVWCSQLFLFLAYFWIFALSPSPLFRAF